MDRRQFLISGAVAAVVAGGPLPALAAPQSAPAARWFAVSSCGESFTAIQAFSYEDAVAAFNEEFPDYIEEEPDFEPEVQAPDLDSWRCKKQPTDVAWVEAGYVTTCSECGAHWEEVGGSNIVGDRVFCDDCLHDGRAENSYRCSDTADLFSTLA